MKILYLDLNLIYSNPTRNNIPLLLKKIGSVDFFGPGYISKEVMKKGVERFYEKNGPYDFVITNEHILFTPVKLIKRYNEIISSYLKNYYFQFDIKELKYLEKMKNFFKNIKSKKIVFLLESDYYNFRKWQIDLLESLDAFFVGYNKQFISSKKEMNYILMENFTHLVNDNWLNFVKIYDNKLIALHHFIGLNEFYFEDISNRKNLIAIPGANYYLRKQALKSLKSYNIKNKKVYNKIYSLLNKIGFKAYSNPVLMKLYNFLFNYQLQSTKYIYTCGSALNWPLRKFFEIPANGAVLLATSFKNSKEMGFIDNQNYVECDYRNIREKVEFLEKNIDLAQCIAYNGQNLIWEKHSIDARANQLKKCFDLIIKDKFNGSFWKNGEFYAKEKE